eukprot:2030299-Pyramimonas_sp.AAC.1
MSAWAESRSLGIARPFLEPIRALLRARRNRSGNRQAAILADVGRDNWTRDKVWSAGYGHGRSCQQCGEA